MTSDTKTLSVTFGETVITFSPVYSPRRKSVEIAVEVPDKVLVTAPEGTPDEQLLAVVCQKAKWIVQQLFEIRSIRSATPFKEMVNGEAILYLGRTYRLDLQVDPHLRAPVIKIYRGQIQMRTKSLEQDYLRRHLINWYREKTRSRISNRIDDYAPKLGVSPASLMIKDQEKRWASCTSTNGLIFNWRSILAPAPVLDYIIVHELCHLLEKSHSKRFWALVRSILPEYELRERWLRENGVRLDL